MTEPSAPLPITQVRIMAWVTASNTPPFITVLKAVLWEVADKDPGLVVVVLAVVAIFGFATKVGVERSRTERARYEHGCLPEPTP